MKKDILFHKMVAAGNDFILVDNRRGEISARVAVVKKWCDRKNSIGADGLILLESSKKADFRMRILNPDGSEAEMCGNGVRCLAKFAVETKVTSKKNFSIDTLAGIIEVWVKNDIVKAKMVEPKELKLDFSLLLENKATPMHFINTGVPHAVSFVESVKNVNVEELGRMIRQHEYFSPRGANANFVSVAPSTNTIDIRTYERGVENETLACGTGSTAAALISAAMYKLKSPVQVKTQSGEILKIYFSKEGTRFYDVFLEGKVELCFEGRVKL